MQEALAHQLGGHVRDCALAVGLRWVMMHPTHAKVRHLHHRKGLWFDSITSRAFF